ncbi:unnamed protein product [Didymodactylos carnosus]|uniref:Uncharacterized protein n=1 Tax=Didymodactylos carnosus TaxID=1234261 RepID=A0A813TA94_9BILA|nr:unnamed protein product [Didymodactylos carnosus]CAF0811724.1 unnamed protein product [Didymodactylos carnosus]CAF3498777.1 unnamed protein product [Didymodactylos carnosus]CAF3597407.1 unnamed protein product [Didymodactylos carnosus]
MCLFLQVPVKYVVIKSPKFNLSFLKKLIILFNHKNYPCSLLKRKHVNERQLKLMIKSRLKRSKSGNKITTNKVQFIVIPTPYDVYFIIIPNVIIIMLTTGLIIFYFKQSASVKQEINATARREVSFHDR